MNAIVINENGFKVEFVLLDIDGKPLFYELQENESIVTIDVNICLEILKPKWTDSEWIETATEEEIEASKPEVVEVPKSEIEILKEELKATQEAVDFILMGGE